LSFPFKVECYVFNLKKKKVEIDTFKLRMKDGGLD